VLHVSRCRFCLIVDGLDDRPHLYSDTYAVAFHDGFPSAPGHTLVIPTRHVGHVRDLRPYEWRALTEAAFRLITETRDDLTIGINDGPLAGQTIPHVHLHLIPRTAGDVSDPRGGIRWVLPETAAYWDTPPATDSVVEGVS
jgi:diadenosine tetraphosphate (Ap4A) HIT family hydrolase